MNTSFNLPSTIHVIGASGRSGKALCQILHTQKKTIVAVVRNLEKWQNTNIPAIIKQADLTKNLPTLCQALKGATHVVSTAHARHIPMILKASPKNVSFVFLGSTRKFTHWPDSHGNGVLYGEKTFLESLCNGVILHPTMIYGTEGENNVQRLAALLRYLPIVPLPKGGRSLIQPIHQSDVTKSILSALSRQWIGPHSFVIAGANALSYRDFVCLILSAAKLKSRPIVSIPLPLLRIATQLTRFIPIIPRIDPDEIQRLVEDKNFDTTPMRQELGFIPMDFTTGIKQAGL